MPKACESAIADEPFWSSEKNWSHDTRDFCPNYHATQPFKSIPVMNTFFKKLFNQEWNYNYNQTVP